MSKLITIWQIKNMIDEQIKKLVLKLEASEQLQREEAWTQLKTLGEDVVPHLAFGYSKIKKAKGRVACVFYSQRYARTSEVAYQLGVSALADRATLVRYRACGLLAYSLRTDAISHLEVLLQHKDPETVADAKAAIDAIKNKNHHFFIDRDHSGRCFWELNQEDVTHFDKPKRSWWKIWK